MCQDNFQLGATYTKDFRTKKLTSSIGQSFALLRAATSLRPWTLHSSILIFCPNLLASAKLVLAFTQQLFYNAARTVVRELLLLAVVVIKRGQVVIDAEQVHQRRPDSRSD